jgi:dihydroorotate dehydrogenase electron transfer subunit
MSAVSASHAARRIITDGWVTENSPLCDEHFRITFRVAAFPEAYPGQFVHLGPVLPASSGSSVGGRAGGSEPLLRRAFSIAGLRRGSSSVEIDVIYRVVGTLTTWLAGLRPGAGVSLLGPQGNRFPLVPSRRQAWLIAGGVGLPPLLWFAEELSRGGEQSVTFFYGAQRASLVALALDPETPPCADGCAATLCASGLARLRVPAVISTDDGSRGFRGHVGQALSAYAAAQRVPGDQLVLYTCGPERMMAFVADFAAKTGAQCYACVERSMACATGMCQSCVVPIRDLADAQGWRYKLCCTDGPVFDSCEVIWDFETLSRHPS